jgi:hypothetical protein
MVIVTSYFQVSNLPILFRPGTSVCTQQHGLLHHHLIIHLFCWVFGSRYANFAGYVIYFSYYFHLFLDLYGIFRGCHALDAAERPAYLTTTLCKRLMAPGSQV